LKKNIRNTIGYTMVSPKRSHRKWHLITVTAAACHVRTLYAWVTPPPTIPPAAMPHLLLSLMLHPLPISRSPTSFPFHAPPPFLLLSYAFPLNLSLSLPYFSLICSTLSPSLPCPLNLSRHYTVPASNKYDNSIINMKNHLHSAKYVLMDLKPNNFLTNICHVYFIVCFYINHIGAKYNK